MNNKVFVALRTSDGSLLDGIRSKVESGEFFNRYGSAELYGKYGRFGFESVFVCPGACFFVAFLSMIGCSYVYFPCGWGSDKLMRKLLAVAEVFGRRMIFEEDWRCR